jgi:hypothetical protein
MCIVAMLDSRPHPRWEVWTKISPSGHVVWVCCMPLRFLLIPHARHKQIDDMRRYTRAERALQRAKSSAHDSSLMTSMGPLRPIGVKTSLRLQAEVCINATDSGQPEATRPFAGATEGTLRRTHLQHLGGRQPDYAVAHQAVLYGLSLALTTIRPSRWHPPCWV